MNSLILVAAGQGSRMGAPVNKLLLKHRGHSLISYTLRHVFQSRFLEELIIVARVEEQPIFADILKGIEHHIPVRFAPGGATRNQSVKNGLSCLAKDSEKVLVHDGARPFVDGKTIDDAFAAISEAHPAVVVGIPCVDTIKEVDGELVQGTLDRSRLFRAQTPQGAFSKLLKASMEALSSEEGITDDASILEKAGVPVTVLPGKEQFFKVTTPGDWSRFTKMIEKEGLPFRIGQGYDIHRYDESRPLMLGGVEIAKTGGLLGHSDADVLLHAIMDALLGAAGLPDIGHYFPDTDPRYEGADSKKLMLEVKRVLSEEGWQAGNIDSTVIAEKPKLTQTETQQNAYHFEQSDEDGNKKGADCCNTSHHQRSNNHHTLRDVLQGDTEGYPPLRCAFCRADAHTCCHALGQFVQGDRHHEKHHMTEPGIVAMLLGIESRDMMKMGSHQV